MNQLKSSFRIFLFFTILTGIIYPLGVTGVSQLLFRDKANGSIVRLDGEVIGSKLIGQQFESAKYFSSRPSPNNYQPFPSGGSNLGITNEILLKMVNERRKQFWAVNQLDTLTMVPSEMLFASGSGLDPHISPGSALLQVERIAKVRNLTAAQKVKLIGLIGAIGEGPQFGIFGESNINVLILNIELDRLSSLSH